MLKKILFLTLLCAGLCPAVALAGQSAPFGLSWGKSLAGLKAMGLELEPLEGDVYVSEHMPKDAEWAANYCLLVSKKQGLVRVIAYTNDILNDQSGQMGRRIYYKLKSELENDFVLLKSEEADPASAETKASAGTTFYGCLESGPCGPWKSTFAQGNLNVEVSLEGLSPEAGYVSVMYEDAGLVKSLLTKSKKGQSAKKKKNTRKTSKQSSKKKAE